MSFTFKRGSTIFLILEGSAQEPLTGIDGLKAVMKRVNAEGEVISGSEGRTVDFVEAKESVPHERWTLTIDANTSEALPLGTYAADAIMSPSEQHTSTIYITLVEGITPP